MIEDNIIKIKVKDREGKNHDLEAPTDMGFNLMEILKAHELPVEGTCGGMALCASCHCYIHSDHELSKPSEDEEDMMDQAFFVEENSRLTCQIKIHENIDGLEIELAPVDESQA